VWAQAKGIVPTPDWIFCRDNAITGRNKTTMLRSFFNSEVEPKAFTRRCLGVLFFVLLAAAYMYWSHARHIENPADKIVPTISQIWAAAKQVAMQPDRTGHIWLWADLGATSYRFLVSLAIVSTGVLLGLMMGLFSYVDALFQNFIIALDKLVALSLLPLLMVMLGIEEGFRIGLAVLAVYPTVVLSAYKEAKGYAEQRKIKARTLGASNWELAFRVVLPGIMPRMIDIIRRNFNLIAVMVIAGEMIVASEGLGYRIAAVRRFMTMDVVIVYVVMITLLLYLADVAVSGFIKWKYPWFNK
jgi:NitT/TauT family transport system permease protein